MEISFIKAAFLSFLVIDCKIVGVFSNKGKDFKDKPLNQLMLFAR